MKQRYPLLLALAFSASAGLHAQIFYSNGATVAVTTGAVVWCNGGATLDNTTNFTNNGSFTTANSTTPAVMPGTFTIDNSSAAQGNGTYQVEQDWVNNATFVDGTSTVRLFGNTQQFITSTNNTVTTFNNLTLLGNGTGNNRKKTLQGVNAISDVGGVDSINNRELETLTQTFFVTNPATTAVYNDQTANAEGFVSSQAPGTFSRVTSGSGAYLFPTGSSVVLTRYRPVMLTPVAGSTNDIYTCRFINHDPDNDGFLRSTNDGLICNANDTFYHAINRPGGTDAADVTIYYIPANDGAWSGISQWRLSNVMWNDMAATSQATTGIFTTRTRSAWGFVNPGDPYVLNNQRPAAPNIVCPSICQNSSANLFVATGGSGYQWTVPGNGTIVSGQGTDSLYVDWTTGSGPVTVVATGANCNSLPSSCTPTILPSPFANFLDTSSGPWAGTWVFSDQSTVPAPDNIVSWTWDFGDGQFSTQQNPSHDFNGSGTYTVTLTATSGAGCTDTVQSVVTVLEGILIPNVFSPNGDGVNDEFYIPNSGLKEYKIEIYDRWGVKVFESDAPDIHWDGRSTSGQPCTDGTYYYILHAVSNVADYSTTGFVTLIGSKKQ
ncbi:MAG TPA: gliding motility-associated C-terminal domain-containing protein [Bacteroidia bacterium]|nr:gliding motility-associated C-terminal domain-containing protein [Bacteroidia bacterium]